MVYVLGTRHAAFLTIHRRIHTGSAGSGQACLVGVSEDRGPTEPRWLLRFTIHSLSRDPWRPHSHPRLLPIHYPKLSRSTWNAMSQNVVVMTPLGQRWVRSWPVDRLQRPIFTLGSARPSLDRISFSGMWGSSKCSRQAHHTPRVFGAIAGEFGFGPGRYRLF